MKKIISLLLTTIVLCTSCILPVCAVSDKSNNITTQIDYQFPPEPTILQTWFRSFENKLKNSIILGHPKIRVSDISIECPNKTLTVGDTIALNINIYPTKISKNAYIDNTYTLLRSNDCVEISGNKVIAKKVGIVKITAVANDGFKNGNKYSDTITLTISEQKPGALFSNNNFLTWEELQNEDTGLTYGFDAAGISNTNIEAYTFYNCQELKEIVLPKTIENIGDYAFYKCLNLTNISNIDNLSHLGKYSFTGCKELKTISIPSNISFINDSAFEGCTSLTSIYLPNNIINIKTNAFKSCSGLTEIKLSDELESIETGAFHSCSNLISVNIPASLNKLGEGVFSNCKNLTNIYVNPKNKTFDSRENCNAIIRTADNTLIIGCQTTNIPNSITAIDNYAFYGCNNLKINNIPSNVKSIGDFAFYRCTSLQTIYIPNSVEIIGNKAFGYCSNLTTIYAPEGLIKQLVSEYPKIEIANNQTV